MCRICKEWQNLMSQKKKMTITVLEKQLWSKAKALKYYDLVYMCTKLTDAKRHKLKITKFMFWLYSQACHFEIPHVTAVASIHLTLSIHVYHQCFLLFSFFQKRRLYGKIFWLQKNVNCILQVSFNAFLPRVKLERWNSPQWWF